MVIAPVSRFTDELFAKTSTVFEFASTACGAASARAVIARMRDRLWVIDSPDRDVGWPGGRAARAFRTSAFPPDEGSEREMGSERGIFQISCGPAKGGNRPAHVPTGSRRVVF